MILISALSEGRDQCNAQILASVLLAKLAKTCVFLHKIAGKGGRVNPPLRVLKTSTRGSTDFVEFGGCQGSNNFIEFGGFQGSKSCISLSLEAARAQPHIFI